MASQFQLIMRTGPTPGATFTLEGDQINIGRDSSNDVTINDAEVSRHHARLTFQGGKYVLEDLGSTNGSFVNGQRLAGPRVLKAGEVVSFGEQIVLVYEVTANDPGATMVSPRAAAVPSASRPASPPPPPPADYAGSIPASPAPEAPPIAEPASNRIRLTPTLITIIVIAILTFCCVVTLLIVDNFSLWCNFPFNILAQILRGPGVCQ
ncbi:MAG TPA: FHA domain-containing protein [Anaerolineales bacterium]|nr:FHA domain-containing protein [Anaerolineales bacterium]